MKYDIPEPQTYPVIPKSTRNKWYVIIVILIVLLSSMVAISLLHPQNITPETSASVSSNYVSAGSTYNITFKSNEIPKSIEIFWGDTQNNIVKSPSKTITLSHVYNSPGIYYITYSVNYNASLRPSNEYIPVYVYGNSDYGSGNIAVYNSSKNPIISNSDIYPDDTSFNFSLSFNSPQNTSYSIFSSKMHVYKNGKLVENSSMFQYNSSEHKYANNNRIFSMKNLTSGFYILKLVLYSGIVNHGKVSNVHRVSFYLDMPVNSNHPRIYINTNNSAITYESASPYNTLDPQVGYTNPDMEILMNTEEFLLHYNETSGKYMPEIANMPYRSHNNSSYTFHINGKVRFQNGTPVTAWDVEYSLVRDLLLEGHSPQTPGWILGQYLLPGNYYTSNTYNNITKAITCNNKTDNVTLHFNQPMTPEKVYRLVTSSGTFITSASFLETHDAAITWNSTGFNKYKSNPENYNNTYLKSNVMANGPYEIYSISPNSIVLIRNPYFTGNSYNPVPAINVIKIFYTSSLSSLYQGLKLNISQIAQLPSSYSTLFNSVSGIHSYSSGVNVREIYNLNSNINTSILPSYSYSNLPPKLFSNISVREAFYNAFPGGNVTLAKNQWDSFVNKSGSEYNLKNTSKGFEYKNNSLVIPIFANQINSGTNISKYIQNLKSVVKGASFPIITEPSSVISSNEVYQKNPMPIYITDTNNYGSSAYYSYYGTPLNYSHLYTNGFSKQLYNSTHKNQTRLMNILNMEIRNLTENNNSTNIKLVQETMDKLYFYIPSGNVTLNTYYNRSINMKADPVVQNYNVVLFNYLEK